MNNVNVKKILKYEIKYDCSKNYFQNVPIHMIEIDISFLYGNTFTFTIKAMLFP